MEAHCDGIYQTGGHVAISRGVAVELKGAMETLPALLLGLSTGKPGDEGEPIVLDGAGDGGGSSGGGGGPSGSGDRNLEPPTDSDDSDFEELTRDQFRASVAGPRINELVAPGLVVKKVVHNGKEMSGVVAMRDFKRCESIGIYSGEVLTSDEYNSTKRPLAKAYAFEMSSVQVADTDLRLIIVPTLLTDGSGVDFARCPLAAIDEPDPGKTANCYVQQVQVDPASMKGPGPSNALEPYVCLGVFTTRAIAAGEELTIRKLRPSPSSPASRRQPPPREAAPECMPTARLRLRRQVRRLARLSSGAANHRNLPAQLDEPLP